MAENLYLTGSFHTYPYCNTNRMHFHYISDHYSFLKHFKGSILSHEVGAMKPDLKIFRHALNKTGIDAAQKLFIDDQAINIAAARTLGIQAFQFTDPAKLAIYLQELELCAD